ncbi:MAG: hypothetical protein K9N38_10150 [Candidatus Marinimicrobia bacterium]|nr:hypothetical protein [Candidatus Neomarinimicrobiota bacterium]
MKFNLIRQGWSSVGFYAGLTVFVGILLSVTVDMGFMLLAGLGAFGPGILREFGVLKDQDEFARMATYRAGYYASLFAGIVAVILISILKAGSVDLEHESLALAIILATIWLVSIFSVIHKFWGVQKAVFRILVIFGSFWWVFIILSHIKEPLTFLMESLLVLPFFILAYASKHWPRTAGALIIIAGITCFFLFRIITDDPELILQKVLVFIMFICPLVVAGVSLLLVGQSEKQDL